MIMKSHRLLLAPAIGAALVAAAWTAPASAISPNPQNGSPNDGVVCRTGYAGALTAGAFVCSKSENLNLRLVCPAGKLKEPTTYVERAGGPDLCEAKGVVITSTSPLGKLTEGTDYAFAVPPDQTKIDTAVTNQIQKEAAALGLPQSEVEGTAAPAVVKVDKDGSLDKSQTPLTLFTRPIPNGPSTSPFPLVK
jgi:hypothetical protein